MSMTGLRDSYFFACASVNSNEWQPAQSSVHSGIGDGVVGVEKVVRRDYSF
jgi:hypothetical protein